MNSKKHILIVTYNDYPVFEGLGVRIKNLARVLVEQGHQVTIFAPNIEYRRPRCEDFPGGKIVRGDIWTPNFLKKNRVIARAWSMVIQTIAMPIAYRKHLRNRPIDLILAEHIYSVPSAIVVKAFTRSKIIVDDIITVSDALKDAGFPRLVRFFTRFEKLLFSYCHDFIYTSPVSDRYYRERGANPTLYVPNGVNCDEFKPVHTGHGRRAVVLFNGSAYSPQNTEAAVNFIAIGKKMMEADWTDLEFRLVCWPAYNLPEAVLEAVTTEKHWLSYQEGVDNIAEEIGAATITLLPYSQGHHLTGGTRLKALEYMACGKLVIATPEGIAGITGLIPYEHYLPAATPDAIPDVLADALRNPDLVEKIGKQARHFIQRHYDWRITSKALLDRLD